MGMARGTDIEGFSDKLKLAMGRANLSRAQVAQALGMDKSVIARWLSGALRPGDHSLAQLSAILGRGIEGFSRADWDRAPTDFAARLGMAPSAPPHAPLPPPSAGFRVTGLKIARQPVLEEPYLGLWVGFMQSVRNRGTIALNSLYFWAEEDGMRCRFTEGRFWGEGPAFAGVGRMQCFWEQAPANDRICAMLFNGVFAYDQIMMEGLSLSAAGDATGTPGCVPMLFFRVGDADTYAGLGGLEGVRAVLARENAARAPEGADPRAPLADLAPATLLALLQPVVGAPRPDGGFDHMLRAPAARAQAALEAVGPDDVMAARAVRRALRRMFGLD
jgi:transcriptional regulator with XRE-family HTH domain